MTTATDYAIIKTSGSQFKAVAGETLRVDMLVGELGSEVTFSNVLLLATGEKVEVGKPYVAGAKVVGQIVRHGKGKKIRMYRFKKKKGYQRTVGHRSNYTYVKVTGISKG
jgi:large subunit ribosomal protein L21